MDHGWSLWRTRDHDSVLMTKNRRKRWGFAVIYRRLGSARSGTGLDAGVQQRGQAGLAVAIERDVDAGNASTAHGLVFVRALEQGDAHGSHVELYCTHGRTLP